jgi:hypothetical protein
VPIENASDKWRNQKGACVSGCHGLSEREQQCEIAVDALPLQFMRCLDAFPG